MARIKRLILPVVLALLTAVALGTYPAAAQTTHSVQRGESLFLIGEKYGVTVNQIKEANELWSDMIVPGQQLVIPGSGNSGTSYTVRKGDTLFLIAQRHGTTYQELMSHNGLQSTMIEPGQILAIPTRNSQATASRSLSVSREDISLLARAVYSEARGEPYKGQVAVAAVVLNRVRSPEFPNTIRGVIFQPWAFTAVHDGQFWLNPNSTAYRAAEEAIRGWDPTNGTLYYWNPITATSTWIWTRSITTSIGKHVFGF